MPMRYDAAALASARDYSDAARWKHVRASSARPMSSNAAPRLFHASALRGFRRTASRKNAAAASGSVPTIAHPRL